MFKPCSVLVVSLQCIQAICKEITTSQRVWYRSTCALYLHVHVHVHNVQPPPYTLQHVHILHILHVQITYMYMCVLHCICTMKMPNNTLGTELMVGVEKGRGKEGGGGERGTCIGK